MLNLWYVDRLYSIVFVGGVHVLRHICGFFDAYAIDGLVNLQGWICRGLAWLVGKADYDGVDGAVRGIGEATLAGGRRIRRVQTGHVGQYVYASVFLAAGALALTSWIIWMTRK